MNTTFASFLSNVYPFVRDCPEISCISAIRATCQDFCRRTQAWQYQTDVQKVTAGNAVYTMDAPPGAAVDKVLQAWCSGVTLSPQTAIFLARFYGPNWREVTGQPRFFYHNGTTAEITLVPKPEADVDNGVSAIVSCYPASSSKDVDSVILDRYAEAISYGTRGRLYDTPNQPYSDPARAQDFLNRYRASSEQARREVSNGMAVVAGRIANRRW